ncbi:MAG: outer membrane beta-barrel protein [Alphaproteobacteria bacterium]
MGGRSEFGAALSVAVLLAAWGVPFAPAYGDDGSSGVQASEGPQAPEQVAQAAIEVPSRITTVPRGQTVEERQRPDLDPLGVRVGAFTLFPSIALEEQYSDNIFATENNTIDDFITRLLPRARLRSNWNNHSLSVYGNADIGRYADNGNEDYEDYTVGTNGRLTILRDTWLQGQVEHQRRHEDRGSPDDVGGVEPTIYGATLGQLTGFHRLNRLNFTLSGTVERLDYDDVATGGGGNINNDDRDRYEMETSLRVGYEVVPNYEAFVRGGYLKRTYDDISDNGLDRDNDGYEIVAGISVDFGGITFGDFFAGYRTQEYDDPALKGVKGPSVGGEITWNVTPLTTIIGTLSRTIEESTSGDGMGNFASGRFLTAAAIRAQHELRRNLIVGANVGYENDDYEGISRTDETLRFGINANYMMYRNLYIRGGYAVRSRDAEIGTDYVENIVFVRLQAQY